MLFMHLPTDLDRRPTALAKATGWSKASYVREALMRHIEDLEDYSVAKQRLDDLEAGLSRTYTLEEVMAELGLDD